MKTDPKTGLPFFPSASVAPIATMNTPAIYALIHQTQQDEDLERAGLSLRRFGIADSITAKLSFEEVVEICEALAEAEAEFKRGEGLSSEAIRKLL